MERLVRALRGRSPVSEEEVSALEVQTAALHDLDLKVPSSHLLPYAVAHLDRLTEVLGGVVASKFRRKLVISAGEAAAFAGWMAWDSGDEITFRRLYAVAIRSFQEVDDSSRLACCLADLSYLPSSRDDARGAEQTLNQGLSQVDSAALSLIERSLNLFSAADPLDNSWTNFLTPARMNSFVINVHFYLLLFKELATYDQRAAQVAAEFAPFMRRKI